MSYLVIARKFRPQTFIEVSGQEHVTRTLANSIRRGKVAHAYLFAGPRGVGKTSIARVFAKALNCEKGPTSEPCAKCTNCLEIAQGNNIAVREIDGASHNSVENVRDLIESFRTAPPPGSRYKVYIIDEVHMFSTAAFNALLKSLEEPPPNTVFILATTEAHKIPETVISRCQRHDFRVIPPQDIISQLQKIATREGMDIEPSVLATIARLSEGSMRDAQSLLERVSAFAEGKITGEEASRVLGTVAHAALSDLGTAILARDPGTCLKIISEVFARGVDPTFFLKEFATYFRNLMVARFGKEAALKELGIVEDERVHLLRAAESVGAEDIHDLVQLAREGADLALRSAFSRYALEALAVRLATREPVLSIAEIIAGAGGQSLRPSPSVRADSQGAVRAQASAPVERTTRDTTVNKEPERSARAPSEAESAPLDWAGFVRSFSESGSRVLTEHLKRLSVKEFALSKDGKRGVFSASGPDFSVSSLQQADNKQKLLSALSAASNGAVWQMTLTAAKGAGAVVEGSLLKEEQDRIREDRSQKTKNVANHPSIQTLQKIFPGSKIENIKLQETDE